MKLRRYIALVFLVVYLSATAGSSWTALTCSCVARHLRSEALCPHGESACAHHPQHAADDPLLAAPCCNHLHLNLELLLVRCCDGERCRQHLTYCLLSDELPVATLAEQPDPRIGVPVRSLRRHRSEPPVPVLRAGAAAACGLRAPPVTV